MTKLPEYESAFADARMRLEQLKAQMARMNQEEADLARAVQGWEAIIALERKMGSVGDSVLPLNFGLSAQDTFTQTPLNETIDVSAEEEEEGENKTQFVRDCIRKRSHLGTTPEDLKQEAKAAGMKHPPSWPYGPIQRLKKKGEIAKRRGKFYPTATGLSLAV